MFMDDEHRSPYVNTTNNLFTNNVIIATILVLLMHVLLKKNLPNLFMERTLQYIFSCNYYKNALLDYGLGLRFARHKLTSKIFTNL